MMQILFKTTVRLDCRGFQYFGGASNDKPFFALGFFCFLEVYTVAYYGVSVRISRSYVLWQWMPVQRVVFVQLYLYLYLSLAPVRFLFCKAEEIEL